MEFSSGLTVRELMVPQPLTVTPEQSVQETVRLMNARRGGSALVVDDGRLVGIFTERDLLHHAGEAPPGWRQRPVADWMTRNPRSVHPDDALEDAMTLMDSYHVRHLPVVENGRVVGMLAARDLVARRNEYLSLVVADRTRELREANERLSERDAEMRMHMTVAGRLQERLLPGAPPDCPEIVFAAHYMPLDPLGGDHYDFATPDDRHVGVLIADASGHSIPAAMVAIMARTAFAVAARAAVQPAAVLARMNRHLHGLTGDHFVTAFYGLFDRESRQFTYASSGHPAPFRVDCEAGRCTPLAAHGLMLGILPDTKYEEHQVQLLAGDKLLFYTDGVMDCLNEEDESFGPDRLEEFLLECQAESVTAIAERLAERLATFRGARAQSDDMTIVAAEVR